MKQMLKGLAAMAAVVSLATPTLAETVNPAAKLSLGRTGAVRAATATKKSSGIAPIAIVAIIVVIAGGALIIANNDNSDSK